jgi:hypothetical protein
VTGVPEGNNKEIKGKKLLGEIMTEKVINLAKDIIYRFKKLNEFQIV